MFYCLIACVVLFGAFLRQSMALDVTIFLAQVTCYYVIRKSSKVVHCKTASCSESPDPSSFTPPLFTFPRFSRREGSGHVRLINFLKKRHHNAFTDCHPYVVVVLVTRPLERLQVSHQDLTFLMS